MIKLKHLWCGIVAAALLLTVAGSAWSEVDAAHSDPTPHSRTLG